MSTAIAEPPPVGTSVTKTVAKTSKEAGVTSFADKLNASLKGGELKVEPAKVGTDVQAITEAIEKNGTPKGLLENLETPTKETVESPKAADWKKVNEERAALRAEKEALMKQVEEFKTKTVDPTKLTELETKLQEATRELEIRAFEKSEKFQRDYQKPYEDSLERARRIAKEFEVEPAVIDRAMTMGVKERIEYLESHLGSGAAYASVAFEIQDAERKKSVMDSALSSNRETLASLTAQERTKALENENRERTEILSAFEAYRPKIAEKIPQFREIAGNDSHNAQVKENFELARKIIAGEADQQDIVAAPYLAVAARSAFIKADKLEKENKALLERLAEYAGNEARVSSSEGSPSNTTGKPESFMERLAKTRF